MSESKLELVAINNERIQLALVDDKARQSLLAEVQEHIDNFTPDTTTVTGRRAIASIAYKVAQTKTTIDAVGKDMLAEAKAKIKMMDGARKEFRDALDVMRDSVREPLTKYEQRIEDEKRIIAGWESTKDLTDIQTITETLEMFCGEMHQNTIEFMDISLQPYAEQVKAAAIATLQANLAKAQEDEAEAKRIEEERAELDRLRKAEADRKLKEEREELERKAAERATAEASVAAQRAIEDANRKAYEAEQRAAMAEAQAKARAEAERQQQAAQEAKRAADQAHRNNIMRAAYMDIRRMIQDAPQDPSKQAEMVVREIAAGNVANVKMEW